MAEIEKIAVLATEVADPAPTPVVEAPAGDPAILGLPIFAAGSVAPSPSSSRRSCC